MRVRAKDKSDLKLACVDEVITAAISLLKKKEAKSLGEAITKGFSIGIKRWQTLRELHKDMENLDYNEILIKSGEASLVYEFPYYEYIALQASPSYQQGQRSISLGPVFYFYAREPRLLCVLAYDGLAENELGYPPLAEHAIKAGLEYGPFFPIEDILVSSLSYSIKSSATFSGESISKVINTKPANKYLFKK